MAACFQSSFIFGRGGHPCVPKQRRLPRDWQASAPTSGLPTSRLRRPRCVITLLPMGRSAYALHCCELSHFHCFFARSTVSRSQHPNRPICLLSRIWLRLIMLNLCRPSSLSQRSGTHAHKHMTSLETLVWLVWQMPRRRNRAWRA